MNNTEINYSTSNYNAASVSACFNNCSTLASCAAYCYKASRCYMITEATLKTKSCGGLVNPTVSNRYYGVRFGDFVH